MLLFAKTLCMAFLLKTRSRFLLIEYNVIYLQRNNIRKNATEIDHRRHLRNLNPLFRDNSFNNQTQCDSGKTYILAGSFNIFIQN